jgi:pyruvate/2-oxoglutarate dehydrogenase complex dihydrolipoamide acyltransferase (E2) component
MQPQDVEYRVVPDTKMRRWMAAAFRSVQHRPMIHALVEVDVTTARARLAEHRASTGESLSFTAFLVGCVATAIDEDKAVQAFRQGSKHFVVFEDVDVYVMIEREVAGQRAPIPYIVRSANRKTLPQLHEEIRTAQSQDVERATKWLQALPDFSFRPLLAAFCWIGRRRPQVWKKFVGTVGVTAVGMFGAGAGWGIPPAVPTLMVTVGGIGAKPIVLDGRVVVRDCLSLTISFDHDIVDGAPAARFAERLKELVESGHGVPGGRPADATVPGSRGGRR